MGGPFLPPPHPLGGRPRAQPAPPSGADPSTLPQTSRLAPRAPRLPGPRRPRRRRRASPLPSSPAPKEAPGSSQSRSLSPPPPLRGGLWGRRPPVPDLKLPPPPFFFSLPRARFPLAHRPRPPLRASAPLPPPARVFPLVSGGPPFPPSFQCMGKTSSPMRFPFPPRHSPMAPPFNLLFILCPDAVPPFDFPPTSGPEIPRWALPPPPVFPSSPPPPCALFVPPPPRPFSSPCHAPPPGSVPAGRFAAVAGGAGRL